MKISYMSRSLSFGFWHVPNECFQEGDSLLFIAERRCSFKPGPSRYPSGPPSEKAGGLQARWGEPLSLFLFACSCSFSTGGRLATVHCGGPIQLQAGTLTVPSGPPFRQSGGCRGGGLPQEQRGPQEGERRCSEAQNEASHLLVATRGQEHAGAPGSFP